MARLQSIINSADIQIVGPLTENEIKFVYNSRRMDLLPSANSDRLDMAEENVVNPVNGIIDEAVRLYAEVASHAEWAEALGATLKRLVKAKEDRK